MADLNWLTLLSAGALGVSVLAYLLLDGTDLGVGMLVGLAPREQHRHVLVLSILPVWDANETWLVLSGGGLLALFPQAYALLLPAVYVPSLLMFTALVLRAMALEFREQMSCKRLSDFVLVLGSLIATLAQGLIMADPGCRWGVGAHRDSVQRQRLGMAEAFPAVLRPGTCERLPVVGRLLAVLAHRRGTATTVQTPGSVAGSRRGVARRRRAGLDADTQSSLCPAAFAGNRAGADRRAERSATGPVCLRLTWTA